MSPSLTPGVRCELSSCGESRHTCDNRNPEYCHYRKKNGDKKCTQGLKGELT